MNNSKLTLNQLRQLMAQSLKQKGVPEADLEARWFLAKTLRIDEVKLWTESESIAPDDVVAKVQEFIARRVTGEPYAYITGSRDFFGREFLVNRHTLIPRPETELIIHRAIAFCARQAGIMKIADFGTGTGCIGLTLLCEIPESELTAIDISPEAIEVAKANAQQLKVSNRVKFICDNVATAKVPSPIDLVVANPPYIDINDPDVEENVRKFEPHSALFAGEEGYQFIREWTLKAAQILRHGGMYLCEIGAKQADRAMQIAESLGKFSDVSILKDLSQKPRLIRAIRAK